MAGASVEVDRALRTRRFLGYWEAMEWARAAGPVLAELELVAHTRPSPELVKLLERAPGHVVKLVHHADDSSGLIGDLVRELLELHAVACDTGMSDPLKLAHWMVRFQFADQDIFELDPVRYANALGEEGLAAYRQAIEELDDGNSLGIRYARERLAVLNRDIDLIVELAGGELRHATQFVSVAHAMTEIGRDDLALEWATRGIDGSNGWQVGALYDFACETHERLGQPHEVPLLRRAHHERLPSASTYSELRKAAQQVDAWDVEREPARASLRERDVRGFVHALVDDGDAGLAWDVAAATPEEIDADQWVRLAERRQPTHPSDTLAAYPRVADEILQETDRRAYARAVRILKRARSAAEASGASDVFDRHISDWRQRYRRRPTMIAMFDKASF
jgi:hypothetical protein